MTPTLRDQQKAFDRTLGARLRYLRKLRRISQQQLGEGIGCTYQQVQKYERGINSIKTHTMLAITRTLGIGFDELFDEAKAPRTDRMPQDQQQLLDSYNRLPEPQQRAMLAVATSMRGPQPKHATI